MKKCPDCAEAVQDDARVCRYCGYRFALAILAEDSGSPRVPPGLPPLQEVPRLEAMFERLPRLTRVTFKHLFKLVPSLLSPGETIVGVATAIPEGKLGERLLLITDRRLVLVEQGWKWSWRPLSDVRADTSDLMYSAVVGVHKKQHVLSDLAQLRLLTTAGSWTVNVPTRDVDRVAAYIRANLG